MFDQVMNAENQEGMDEQTFEESIDLVFTTMSSAGTEVELVPGGKSKKVTYIFFVQELMLLGGKIGRNM